MFTDSHIVGYTQLTLDGSRDQLLVGARDRLFRLSLDDLTLLEEADISVGAPVTFSKLPTLHCLVRNQEAEERGDQYQIKTGGDISICYCHLCVLACCLSFGDGLS